VFGGAWFSVKVFSFGAAAIIAATSLAATAHGQEPAPQSAPQAPPQAAPQPASEPGAGSEAPPPLTFPATALLDAAGPPEQHADGPIKRGVVLLSLPVTHAQTGVLRQDVKKLGLFAKASLPAGTPVFGLPMTGSQGFNVIWCAPRSQTRGDKIAWSTTCFPKDAANMTRWVDVYEPLFPIYLSFSANGTHGATEVTIEPKRVALPVMRLTFTFTEWDKDDADIFISVESPGTRGPIGNRSLPRLADGSVRLKAFGGEFKLTQVGTDRHAALLEVITPPKPDAKPEF